MFLCNVRCSHIMGFLCKTTIKRLGETDRLAPRLYFKSLTPATLPLYGGGPSISITKHLDVPSPAQTYTMCLLKVV